MRRILLITGLMLCSSLFSQEKIDEELHSFLSDFSKFSYEKLAGKKFANSVDKLDNIPEHLQNHCDTIVIRDLDFGVQEAIYSIKLNYLGGDSEIKQSLNNLHVLSTGSTILGIIRNDLSREKVTPYFDKNLIAEYVHKHDSLYGTKTTQNDLVKALTTKSVYGYMCGLAPQITSVPQRNGLWFDNVKNIATFRQWLKSYSPEEQAYGADALTYLYKKPSSAIGRNQEKLMAEDKKLAQYIMKRNSVINTCAGCTYGIYRKVF